MNVFDQSPMEYALGARPDPAQPNPADTAPTAKENIDRIATRYNVPANVLFAIEEAGGNTDATGAATRAEEAAKQIAATVASGKTVDDAVAARFGQSLTPRVMARAYDIADEFYPKPDHQDPGFLGDVTRQLGGSFIKAGGAAIRAVGLAGDSALNIALPKELEVKDTALSRATSGLADYIERKGTNIQAGVSRAGKIAIRDSSPNGSIFEPSTWTLGDAPSLRGYAILGADVLGSFLPVVATAALTKNPYAAGAVGGAIGGGAGAETARDIILDMAQNKGPNGRPLIESQSAYYRDAIKGGKTPEEALQLTVAAAERMAFLMTTPFSALGGAATEKILEPGIHALTAKGIAARIGGKAALSALEEGTQEVSETIATRKGTNVGAGTDLTLTDGTFGDFILGALGGVGPGGLAGITSHPANHGQATNAPEAPLGLPAPLLGLPAPPRALPAPDAQSYPDGDGSATGEAGAPINPVVGGGGASADIASGIGPQPEPTGHVSALAAQTPNIAPSPQATDPNLPGSIRFPDHKPGKQLRVATPDGKVLDAVFLREEPGAVVVRIAGEEIAINDRAFDDAMIRARAADDQLKQDQKIAAKAGKPAPKEATAAPATAAPAAAGSQKLSEQAAAKIVAPSVDLLAFRAAIHAPMTPEEVAQNIKAIEDQAAVSGWNRMMQKKRDLLRAKRDLLRAKQESEPGPASGSTPKPKAPSVAEQTIPQMGAKGATNPLPEVAPAAKPRPRELLAEKLDIVGAIENAAARRLTARETVKELGDKLKGIDDAAVANGEPWAAQGEKETLVRAVRGKLNIPSMDDRAEFDKWVASRPAKAPATPMKAPGERVQPDLLGGRSQTEAEMAIKERRKREWGAFLGIAENRSPWQGNLERASVKITKNEITLTGPHGTRTTATDGMTKDDIAGWARRAMGLIGGFEPLPNAGNGSSTPDTPLPENQGGGKNSPSVHVGQNVPATAAVDTVAARHVARKSGYNAFRAGQARVLPPEIQNEAVGYREAWFKGWDAANVDAPNFVETGFKQEAAAKPVAAPAADQGKVAVPAKLITDWWTTLETARAMAANVGFERESVGDMAWNELPRLIATVNDRLRVMGHTDWLAPDPAVSEKPAAPTAPATISAPTAAEVKTAAKEADRNPTEAQKEAGNYQMGHIQWNGLDITIENAKGSYRRGKDQDGEEWSVKMPAHYGYIKRTKGADGDHVDVYMGDNPESDKIFVVDQKDLKTGKFDEHKNMLGFVSEADARAAYIAGFSDGKGVDRMGAMKEMTVAEFKDWIENGNQSKPVSSDSAAAPQPVGTAKPTPKRLTPKQAAAERMAALRDYFTPGNVVTGDGNRGDRVISFDEKADGDWTVTVQHVVKGNGGWIVDPADDRIRTHRTMPTPREFSKGPLERAAEAKPAQAKNGWNQIGYSTRSFPLYEDENGVRSYVEGGIRVTEPVGIVPTREGSSSISINKDARTRDFLTKDEYEAKKAAQDAAKSGSAQGVAANTDTVTNAAQMSEQLTGAPGQATVNGIEYRLAHHNNTIGKGWRVIYTRLAPWSVKDASAVENEKPWTQDEARAKAVEMAFPKDATEAQSTSPADVAKFQPLLAEGFTPTNDGRLAVKYRNEAQKTTATYILRSIGRDATQRYSLIRLSTHDGHGGLPPNELLANVRGPAEVIDALKTDTARQGGYVRIEAAAIATPITNSDDAANRSTIKNDKTEQNQDPIPAPQPDKSVLSVLSGQDQDRAALLRARIAERLKNQLNSGIDPELVKDAVELVGIYIKAGIRKFRALVDQIAADMGLTAQQAEPWVRTAYNHARDDMELADANIDDMDDSKAVLAEVKKLRAEPSQNNEKTPILEGGSPKGTNDEPGTSTTTGVVGQDGKPENDRGGNLAARKPRRNRSNTSVAGTAPGFDFGDGPLSGDGGVGARPGGEGSGSGNGTDQGGLSSVGRPRNGPSGLDDAGPGTEEPAPAGRSNYRITNPEALFAGGPKARFAKNKAAIETFQQVSDEGREPTPEELDKMASFIGWGSFGQELFQGTFDYRRPIKPEWQEEDAWLRDFLGKEAWESAQNSIINAHYTDPPTVKAIWSMVAAMGFKGGRILEPSMGVGNFFGLMPQAIAGNSALTGIELDKVTGGIASMLYPRANVRIMGYEKSTTPDNFYDLVIGNWPFANFSPADRRYAKLGPSLHDYFFLKALDQVRPGGLVVGLTSAFSMDGQKNRGVRLQLAKNAELVTAFRLPSGAFEKYAGTKVVTDLIVLRKRVDPIADVSGEAWVRTEKFKTPSGPEINLNQYYIDNPDQILGTIDYGHGTTYFKAGMIVNRPDNMAELLDGIASRVPTDGYQEHRRTDEPRFVANNTEDRRFAVTIGKDGALYHVRGDQMAPLGDVLKYRTSNKVETATREAQFRALVDIRRKAGAVIDADRDGAEDADTKRKALKSAYEAFRKAHGTIANSYAIREMRGKLKDPFAGLLLSLEGKDGKPAAIMERPTVRAARKLDNPTIRDAYVMARNESITLNVDRIAELAKEPVAKVVTDLLASNAIYRTPGNGYAASDDYLSGNVRVKLREAQEAMAQGEDMAGSIAALEAVQPTDIPYFNIEARFGADWLPPEVNRQFIIETLGIEHAGPKDVVMTRGATGWRIDLSDSVSHMSGVSDITGASTPGRNGTGLSLKRFLEATLNTQTLNVTESDGDGGTVKSTKETDQANAKSADLREKFGEWIWKDAERRVDMEHDYNEAMNSVATPKVDGSFLEFPGMALKRGDHPLNLRKHQADAIWRGILNQRGIYGHEVGTGKTITMAGIAVESRRYGLAKKPLLIAHNANSSAVAAEAQETYPGAKIMYVDNLSPGEINTQLARMQTEDWDLIVIPHSLIDRMALTEKTLMDMAAHDIAAYEREAIEAAEEEGIKLTTADMDGSAKDLSSKLFKSPTAKEMVKARNRLIENIRKQALRSSKEGAVSFEDLGIDMLLVDENHEFKKPPLPTRMQVKGLNTGTSNRSLALRFLTSYIKSQRGGTGVHVFTGTPITNTLSEIYHQMYYVMDDVMRVNRVDTWDGFFKAFANSISDVEITSTNEYENVERLAAFINVSELRRIAGQFMDIVFADDMPEFKPRETASGKTMKSPDLTASESQELLDGRMEVPEGRPYKKVIHDIGPMGTDQKRILDDVVRYAAAFKRAGGKERREIMLKGGPNAPIVYNNVPNRASMDPRLQEPDAEDDPQSKANRAVKNIARIYDEEPLATQVLFMDEGYSDEATRVKTNRETGEKTVTKVKKFNLVADIVDKLVKAGVKRSEIAIVAGGVDADTKRVIADKMNRREIRVVIGQTRTLGVGVNMQENLRAMHHLDAPWMPGDLEQRNGRGQRQGNKWNTVLEYRYLTEGLDGRRWQVLAIKDRFIKAFLKAKDGLRTIEGDAADDTEAMDGSSLADTLSEAAGDPRLMQSNKLKKRIEKLQNRERIYSQGIADAISKAKRLRQMADMNEERLPNRRKDATHVLELRKNEAFSATVNGKTYDARPEAEAAIEAYLPNAALAIPRGESRDLAVEVNGFKVAGSLGRYASLGNVDLSISRSDNYNIGRPSLQSIEASIRRIPERLASAEADVADERKQAERLDVLSKEPFQQEKDLAQKKADMKALLADMEANPVPAPAWLRQGAPIDTLIYVDGKERVVTGHVWSHEGWFVSTEQGNVAYTDVKDEAGLAVYDQRPFEAPTISEGSKLKTGDEPKDMRSALIGEWANQTKHNENTDRLQAILDKALAAHGLKGKVDIAVIARIVTGAQQVFGLYHKGSIGISPTGPDATIPLSILNHEIIHALRDEKMWNRPYGLFTEEEWNALIRRARRDTSIMADVKGAYGDESTEVQDEEAVAELYRRWAKTERTAGPLSRLLGRISSFFRAVASAFADTGYNEAAAVMQDIASGKIGRRAVQAANADGAFDPGSDSIREMRPELLKSKAKELLGSVNWRMPDASFFSDLLTDAMASRASILSVVPGRALFAELGKHIMSAQAYLRGKEEMDALRNKWHERADTVAQDWLDLRRKDPKANDVFMDLMHRTTIAGVDPSKPMDKNDPALARAQDAVRRMGRDNPKAAWAVEAIAKANAKAKAHFGLQAEFDAMPKPFQDLYRHIASEYGAMGDAFEAAVVDNIAGAQRIALKRAERAHRKELERIRDEGLTGEERDAAIKEADTSLQRIRDRGGWSMKAKMAELRKAFESNRLTGPYFPLARFGTFFATIRDSSGKVISFSRFETKRAQREFVDESEKANPGRVQQGAIGDSASLKKQVDPGFVADVQIMLDEFGADGALMDAVWQRWLETLPDQSIRTSNIHRKNRAGFSGDAYRAFGNHMFHGAHQLARLKYGLQLEEHLNDAEEEAARATDPTRAALVVNEMRKRHQFTMNPAGGALATKVGSLAFIWYLGATPGAALANMTQTTVVGIPLMMAKYKKAGLRRISGEITKAGKDFISGKMHADQSPNLTADERRAFKFAIGRGTIDKTQAHDLASVAETGIEYSGVRERWMKRISFMFHHAERFNREITFLANYRLARADGQTHEDAAEAAADMTWKIHFDYQNTARPRIMQTDALKILTIFRQFQVNMLWRLFRDSHQALAGASKAERAEAKTQLLGVTLSLMAHAGIRGVWGYGLVMALMGLFFPGGSDDAEEWLQDALLMEGDNTGVAAWNYMMGAALNGVPGQVAQIDLRDRIGMPNLWFRSPSRDLEGQDLYNYWVGEALGPAGSMGQNFFRSASYMANGDIWRGTEAAAPKAIRDLLKTARYAKDGVQTISGDPILDHVNPWQMLMQASGFTPAQVAERYEINNHLMNAEKSVLDERKSIHKAATDAVMAGEPLPPSVIEDIRNFNVRWPEYPITPQTIKQSLSSRIRMKDRKEFGVSLNPKINDRLRSERAPAVYN